MYVVAAMEAVVPQYVPENKLCPRLSVVCCRLNVRATKTCGTKLTREQDPDPNLQTSQTNVLELSHENKPQHTTFKRPLSVPVGSSIRIDLPDIESEPIRPPPRHTRTGTAGPRRQDELCNGYPASGMRALTTTRTN